MSEFWQAILCAGLGGVLLGTLWGRWVANSYWHSKTPDKDGFRTAIYSRGKPYYVVTAEEYVRHIMGPWPKLWLWKDGDRFLAFDHEFPTYDNGDPQVLGEPAATAMFRPNNIPFSRVERGPGYLRYSVGMPPREGAALVHKQEGS